MRFLGFIALILVILVSFTPRISAYSTSKISGSRIAKFCSKQSNQLRFRPAFINVKILDTSIRKILEEKQNNHFESATKHVWFWKASTQFSKFEFWFGKWDSYRENEYVWWTMIEQWETMWYESYRIIEKSIMK